MPARPAFNLRFGFWGQQAALNQSFAPTTRHQANNVYYFFRTAVCGCLWRVCQGGIATNIPKLVYSLPAALPKFTIRQWANYELGKGVIVSRTNNHTKWADSRYCRFRHCGTGFGSFVIWCCKTRGIVRENSLKLLPCVLRDPTSSWLACACNQDSNQCVLSTPLSSDFSARHINHQKFDKWYAVPNSSHHCGSIRDEAMESNWPPKVCLPIGPRW